jgi:hypothetical protein
VLFLSSCVQDEDSAEEGATFLTSDPSADHILVHAPTAEAATGPSPLPAMRILDTPSAMHEVWPHENPLQPNILPDQPSQATSSSPSLGAEPEPEQTPTPAAEGPMNKRIRRRHMQRLRRAMGHRAEQVSSPQTRLVRHHVNPGALHSQLLCLPSCTQDEDNVEEGATLLTPEPSADDSLAHPPTAEAATGPSPLPAKHTIDTPSAMHEALRPSTNVPKGAPPVSMGGNLTSAPTLEATSGSSAVHPPITDTFESLISRLENLSFWHVRAWNRSR